MRHSLFTSSVTAIFAGLILFAGCKEDTIIKSNISPGDNDLGTQTVADTFTVITKSVLSKRFRTNEKISGFPVIQALGTVTDDFFGRTNAGLYFQVLPTVNDFAFSAGGYTIDSAILILPYSGFSWGNRTDPQPQKFQVYQLAADMDPDENKEYYSDEELATGNLIADAVVNIKSAITDTPEVAGGDTARFKHIRIPLNQSYIDDVRSRIGTSTFSTDGDFLSHFKGFYVVPDSNYNKNNGANLLTYILYDGGGNYSRVAVAFYYREDGNSETKVAFFNYNRDKSAYFNRIKRTYTGFPAQAFIDRYQSSVNISDDTLLLQNEPGLSIDIRLPHVDQIPASSILKAQLVLTQISSGSMADSLPTPNRLTVVGIDEAGEEYQINDFGADDVNAAIAFVDGQKNEEKDANGNNIITYKINIPRELQKAINDKRNELHLRIRGARSFPAAYRLVAGGRNHNTYKTQLNIVYSKPK